MSPFPSERRKATQREQYRIRRRARNFKAKKELELTKLEGARLAKEQADQLLAASESKPVISRSLATGKSKRSSTFARGVNKNLPPFTIVANRTAYDAIPDPSKMTERQLEDYGRKIILKRQEQVVETAAQFNAISLDPGEKYIASMDLYNEERKILRKRHGVNYRSHLRMMAKDELTNLRQSTMYSTGISIDTTPRVKPRLKPTISAGQAAEYISTRVSSTGRQLPGFGQAVKQISEAGILTPSQISELIKDAPNSNNLTQLVNAMGFDDYGIPSYGDHLRMISQQGGPSYSSQQLAMKKQWMTEHGQLIQEKKLADRKIAEAQAKKARAEAILTSNIKDPNLEIQYNRALSESIKEVSSVTQKKAISARTMERLMSSHSVAAGVAAGGLGLMYMFNRRRGEEQVGR